MFGQGFDSPRLHKLRDRAARLACLAHNQEVAGSNPAPATGTHIATNLFEDEQGEPGLRYFFFGGDRF